jgi:hypothetical protein
MELLGLFHGDKAEGMTLTPHVFVVRARKTTFCITLHIGHFFNSKNLTAYNKTEISWLAGKDLEGGTHDLCLSINYVKVTSI